MQSQGQQNIKLDVISIPYLPHQVDLDDVTDVNGKLSLLPEHDIQQIRRIMENLDIPNASYRFSKTALQTHDLPATYSIIKTEKTYYAVYKGIRQDKALGFGTFGTAKLVLDLETFEWLCLKLQSEKHKTPEYVAERPPAWIKATASNEYQMLKKAGEANSEFERTSPTKGYQHSTLTRLAKGNELFLHCSTGRDPTLPDVQWLQIAIDMCAAIKNLHDNHQLLHCDIKTENFIYDPATGEISIIDFGAACDASRVKDAKPAELKGTYGFFAPEVLREIKYSKKSDIYALGVTLLELLKLGCFDEKMHFITYSEADMQCKIGARIRSQAARREILHYMRDQMMAAIPETRPDISKVIAFLEATQKKHLSLPARTVSIGILNVEEYINSAANEKAEIIAALHKVNKVMFIDTINRGQKKYIELTREFKKYGVIAGTEVHVSPDEVEAAASVTARLENDQSQAIYCYFHVTNKPFDWQSLENHRIKALTPGKTTNIKLDYFTGLPVSPAQYNLLKKNLQMEIVRMQNTQEQELMIQAVTVAKTALDFEELHRNNRLSYQDIYTGLIDLQNKAALTRGAGGFFAKTAEIPPANNQGDAGHQLKITQ